MAASLAVHQDVTILDADDGLRVLAVFAKDELGDVTIKIVLQLAGFVSTVDDPAIVLWVDVRLSTKFEAKVLDDVSWRTSKLLSNVAEIDDNSFDAISFSSTLDCKRSIL